MSNQELKTAISLIAKEHAPKIVAATGHLINSTAKRDKERMSEIEAAEADLVQYLAEYAAITDDVNRPHISGLIRDTQERIDWIIDKRRLEAEWSGLDSRKALYESLRVAAEATATLVL